MLNGPARILMTTDAVGGVWRYALDATSELNKRGLSVDLVGLGPPPSEAQRDEAKSLGLDLAWIDVELDWQCDGYAALRRSGLALDAFVTHADPSLLHLNNPAFGPFISKQVPRLAACHSCLATWWWTMKAASLPRQWHIHRRMTALGLAGAGVVTAPSAAYAHTVQDVYGPLPQHWVIYNGTPPVPAAPKEAYVLSAGRWWDEAKNFAALDAAAGAVDWPVYAAGPLAGPGDQTVTPRSVRPLGDLASAPMRRWIAAAPIFVSVSLYEPFGLAVLEAASAGAGLVLADIPTFRELWDGCAVFVDGNEPDAIASALNELASDAPRREHLAAKAQQRAQDYTLEKQAAGLRQAYDWILRERRLAG